MGTSSQHDVVVSPVDRIDRSKKLKMDDNKTIHAIVAKPRLSMMVVVRLKTMING